MQWKSQRPTRSVGQRTDRRLSYVDSRFHRSPPNVTVVLDCHVVDRKRLPATTRRRTRMNGNWPHMTVAGFLDRCFNLFHFISEPKQCSLFFRSPDRKAPRGLPGVPRRAPTGVSRNLQGQPSIATILFAFLAAWTKLPRCAPTAAKQNILPNPSWVSSTAAWLESCPRLDAPEHAKIIISLFSVQHS